MTSRPVTYSGKTAAIAFGPGVVIRITPDAHDPDTLFPVPSTDKQAKTLAGTSAKARPAVAINPDGAFRDDWIERLTASVLRDVIAIGGAGDRLPYSRCVTGAQSGLT